MTGTAHAVIFYVILNTRTKSCSVILSVVYTQESQLQELEVRLQSAEADLKTAERRVDTLQDALKMQEEEIGSGEEDEGDMSRSYDDLSSSGGSYQIGELSGSKEDLSDSRDTEHRLSSHLKGLGGGRSATPRVEDYTSPTHHTRRNRFNLDAEDDDVKLYSRRKRASVEEDDDLLVSRRHRTRIPLSDEEKEEEEKKPRKSYLSKLSDEEDDLAKSPTRRRNRRYDLGASDDEGDSAFKTKNSRLARGKLSPDKEEEVSSRRRYNRILISDDEGDEDLASWRRGREKSRLEDDRLSPPGKGRGSSPPGDNETGSYRQKKYQLSDEEEDKRSPSPFKSKVTSPTRVNGEQSSLTNGTKTSEAGEKEGEEGIGRRGRTGSISKNLVSKEQEQLYSVAQNRRRRRRTGDAKSTRQTAAAQNNGSAS